MITVLRSTYGRAALIASLIVAGCSGTDDSSPPIDAARDSAAAFADGSSLDSAATPTSRAEPPAAPSLRAAPCPGGICSQGETSCDDGTDDDGDGKIDCEDPDCAPEAHCFIACPDGAVALSFTATGLPLAITDLATAVSSVSVTGTGRVSRIGVRFSATHTRDGDLNIALVSPIGTYVDLSSGNGGTGDHYTATQFAHTAATAITAGSPPFTGQFRPEGPLLAVYGEPPGGTWQLQVTDTADGETGSITEFRLYVCRCTTCETGPQCADGINNDGDIGHDCRDRDCNTLFGCEYPAELSCNDIVDNDADGAGDCSDSDCVGTPACFESACADGVDNDGDRQSDCNDVDCIADAACFESACTDTIDNDGDGLLDCEDPNCNSVAGCETFGELTCADGMDNDGDTFVDCRDTNCHGRSNCQFGAELTCGDGFDNDGDTRVDCTDFDCRSAPACAETACADGIDNDGDLQIDCIDPDCARTAICAELICNDVRDNDGDGTVDCGDLDCDRVGICEWSLEWTCGDGADNDGDRSTDCLDYDCDGDLFCEWSAERTCGDGLDNDADGLTDCADLDCRGLPACGEYSCNDRADNDSNGLTDCLDPQCNGYAGCEFGREVTCTGGFDNDGDGLTDCTDPDCFTTSSCNVERFCANGIDDDNDGRVDCADTDCAANAYCDFTCPPGSRVAYWTAEDLPRPISDLRTTSSFLNVIDSGYLSNLVVRLSATHTFTGDLQLHLYSPSGTLIVLSERRGGSGDNYLGTTFDDAAVLPIVRGAPPFTGTFKPESQLEGVFGLETNGTWHLDVTDLQTGNTGQLTRFEMRMCLCTGCEVGVLCVNGADDDSDGAADCLDSFCATSLVCTATTCSGRPGDPILVPPCDGPDDDLCIDDDRECIGGYITCFDLDGTKIDVCNGLNDDCDPASPDGSEDPGIGATCDGTDSDFCHEGTRSCISGAIACDDATGDTLDICNGRDDDCDIASADGAEDVRIGLPCDGPDTDLCNEGVYACSRGAIVCTDATDDTLDICNGRDDDCDAASADGTEDVGVGRVCDGTDSDLCNEGVYSCLRAALFCDDLTASTLDLCNGRDDDCDARSADGSEDPSMDRACDGADSDLCAEGVTYCLAGGVACTDVTTSTLDICNALDDDCDAASADGSEDTSLGRTCDGPDTDLCAEGVTICNRGMPSCDDATGSTLDVCNGRDDDCDASSADGTEDPMNGSACDGADGDLCAEGVNTCTAARWVCSDTTADTRDVCNGLDDDCDASSADGSEDVSLGTRCDGPDTDLCTEGITYCAGGAVLCNDTSSSTLDTCNGLDDDCDARSADGSEDPILGSACDGPDTDLCNEGTLSCSAGVFACSDTTTSTVDLCNQRDDDCDPASTDGSEDPGTGGACDSTDSDLCTEDASSCVAGRIACIDRGPALPELCNGRDDDCNPWSNDGTGDPAIGRACDGGDSDLCAEGSLFCSGGGLSCNDTTDSTLDLCNGADDDCDPASADGAEDPGNGRPCDGPDGDLCLEGTNICSAARMSCNDSTGTTVDVCNGRDDDCNPGTADGSAEFWLGSPCDGPDSDLCRDETATCSGGAYTCNDIGGSQLDLCNGRDDDCDPGSSDGSEDGRVGTVCGSRSYQCGETCSTTRYECGTSCSTTRYHCGNSCSTTRYQCGQTCSTHWYRVYVCSGWGWWSICYWDWRSSTSCSPNYCYSTSCTPIYCNSTTCTPIYCNRTSCTPRWCTANRYYSCSGGGLACP